MRKSWGYIIVLIVIILLLMLIFRDSFNFSPRGKSGNLESYELDEFGFPKGAEVDSEDFVEAINNLAPKGLGR